MKRVLVVGLLSAVGSIGAVVYASDESDVVKLREAKGVKAVSLGKFHASQLGRAAELSMLEYENKLLTEQKLSRQDVGIEVARERAYRGAMPFSQEIAKGREIAGEKMAQGYFESATSSNSSRQLVADELLSFHTSKAASASAAQVSQLADDASLHLQALQIAQSQKLIEQNDRIIALLEQQSKKPAAKPVAAKKR